MMLLTFMAAALAAGLPGQESYLAAREAERAGQYQDALHLYSRCMEQDSHLRPYARVRAAACMASAGNGDGALALFESSLRELPEGPWTRMAHAEFARFLAAVGRYEQSIPIFDAALDNTPDIWFLYSLRWDAAEASLETSDTDARGAAFAYLRGVAEETVIRKKRQDAAALLLQSDDPRDRIAAGFAYVKSREYSDAEKLIPVIEPRVANYIDLRNRLEELRGRVLLGKGNAAEGYAVLRRLAEADSPDPRAYAALADAVPSLLSAKLSDEANAAIWLLQEKAPGSEALADAMYGRADYVARDADATTSAEAYAAVHTACPDTDYAARALFAAATQLRGSGQWKKSAEHYLVLAKEYPESTYFGESIYWAGQMLEHLGESNSAADVYGLVNERHLADYYAHRACERRHELQESGAPTFADLRAGGTTSFVRPLCEPVRELPEVDPALAENPAIQRLQLFGHHGFEEAEWEALYLMRGIESNPHAASIFQAMGEAGVAYSAIQVVKELHWGLDADGRPTPERLRVLHPRAYWPEVVAISIETGVDPYLILSIAYHESTFRPGLTSHAGARGLMQVMPGTAKYLMQIEPTITDETIANLDSPINSLRLGAHYLMRMIERSDANYAFALASYNAGPGNLSKWRKARPSHDLHTFIEAIPFSETNRYVKKVLGTYAAYRSLYPPYGP